MQVFKNLSSRTLRTSPQGCGVWIRVHFLRTRIQLLFSADPDQLKTPLLRNCHEIHVVAYIFVFFPSGTVFVDYVFGMENIKKIFVKNHHAFCSCETSKKHARK